MPASLKYDANNMEPIFDSDKIMQALCDPETIFLAEKSSLDIDPDKPFPKIKANNDDNTFFGSRY